METHSEEQLSLQVVLDFHNHEAVLLSHALLEGKGSDVVLDLPLIQRFHAGQIDLCLKVL